jgi:hypothetical protein
VAATVGDDDDDDDDDNETEGVEAYTRCRRRA